MALDATADIAGYSLRCTQFKGVPQHQGLRFQIDRLLL
jgi:hypothetical protein